MNTQLIKRIAIVVVFVGLSLGGWLATRAGSGIESVGGTWAAPDATWHETDGAWRGTLTFAPVRVKVRDVSQVDLLAALCSSTLDNLASLGADGVTASNVYRLDLNVLLEDETPIFALPASVPVTGGACQIDLSGDAFHPTYPAPIAQWYLAGTGMVNGGGQGVFPIAEFQSRPDMDADLSDFDFVTACRFLINDPHAWGPWDQEPPSEGTLRIVVRKEGANLGSLASVGAFVRNDLTIEDGNCSLDGAN